MIAHLKAWWATHVTWLALLVSFVTPSVNTWIAAHPAYAATIGAGWAILLHILPSPAVSTPPAN